MDADRPFLGAMIFRVGMFDEHLRERGITHLVEHLAFSRLRNTELEHNGTVEGNKTTIWAHGEPQRVGSFLTEICSHLGDLPTDRLRVERGVLEQEAAQRAPFAPNAALHSYFGPRGPGATNLYEHGLGWLGAAEVEAWSARYFTRRNAVLVFTGEPPSGLSFDLPSGEPMPLRLPDRERTPAPSEPTLLDRDQTGVAWATLAAFSSDIIDTVTAVSVPVLSQRLEDRLRHDLGLVYAVGNTIWRLDRSLVFLNLYLESAEHHSRQVSDEFIDVLARYAEEGPRSEEIERLVRLMEARVADHPDAALRSMAFEVAERALCGWRQPLSLDEYRDAVLAVDLNDAGFRFREAHRQSYFIGDPTPRSLPIPIDVVPNDPGPGVVFRRRIPRMGGKGGSVKRVSIGPGGISCTFIDRSASAGESRTPVVWAPLEDIELITFFESFVVVHTLYTAFAFDTAELAGGDGIERTIREQLPPDKVIPREQ